MIHRLAALVEDAVERFLNAVVDRLTEAWAEEER